MAMFKVKKAYLGAVFNKGKGEWIPKFVFQSEQEARNWQLMEGDSRRVRPVGFVTDEEVE